MEQDAKIQGLVKWGLGVLGLGAVAAPLGLPNYGFQISLSILLLLVLCAGGYLLSRAWKRKREKQQFDNALRQENTVTPRALSDPNKRAKLDDLRRRFEEGVKVYASRGKDLYTLPWYVLVGEPGSGKTEAIRRSNVGFPPGLQDEFQGAGGTINMHWWFTNYGVLLDTAGRLLFEEVKPGESSEWKEFLNLLKKTRPHCPINGLFLVLPVDSLIKDSADKIGQKATRIAQQLDLIQRTLDIRFPVYVLVTKCDLLTGFREFFDTIDDPHLQHQMMGWSNPEPLDTPFRVQLVDQHLNEVAERLKRRRLNLLRDPAASSDVSNRRVNEVDALYTLPQSMMLIAPRLRRYLETIFVAGEWSAKPVFLRGIYFTSSLREGAELDEALAQALGIPVAELPGGRIWERDRAFFLRDLFIEKAFRERGLVTRAAHTGRMLRNRQAALIAAAFAVLALFALWSWLGWRNLNQSVRQESHLWQMATQQWNQGLWNPIVRPGLEDPLVFRYAGNDPVTTNSKITLEDYHHRLQMQVRSPLAISGVFKPIAWVRPAHDLDRKLGQRILFERSILWPEVENTRLKMIERGRSAAAAPDQPIAEEAAQRHRAALLSLIQLEADQVFNKKSLEGVNAAQNYIQSFTSFLTESNGLAPRKLVDTLAWIYSPSGGQGVWPPPGLSGGDTLAANQAIDQGLNQFLAYARQSQQAQAERLKILNTIRDLAWEFQKHEAALIKAAEEKKPIAPEMLEALSLAKSSLHFNLLEAKYQNLVKEGNFSLAAAYGQLISESQQTSTNALGEIYRIMSDGVKPVTQGLFGEIRNKLLSFQNRNTEEIAQSLNQATNVAELDRNFLADYEAARHYMARCDLYQQAFNVRQARIDPQELLGQQWGPLDALRKTTDEIRGKVTAYQGGFKPELNATCLYLLEGGWAAASRQAFTDYIAYVTAQLNALPTNRMASTPVEFLQTAKAFLEKLEADLSSQELSAVPASERRPLTALLPKANSVKTAVARRYAESRESSLNQHLAFPVLFDHPDKMLNSDQLRSLQAEMTQLRQELASPLLAYYPAPPLEVLKNKVNAMTPVLGALFSEDHKSLRTCRLAVDPKQSDKISRFRWVSLSMGSQPAVTKEISGGPQEFGTIVLDQPLKIEVRKFLPSNQPNDPETRPVNGEDEFWMWGPLDLIRKYRDQSTRSPDGRTWHVALPVRDNQQQGAVSLMLTFEQPLPPLADWPALKTWSQHSMVSQ